MHVYRFRPILALVLAAFVFPHTAFALTPNDPYFDEQWYLDQIDASTAWGTETGSSDVVVAVLDTGVDIDHPDLVENVWTNADEIADNNKDDDKNGFVDDVYGWDFVQGDNDPSPTLRSDSSIDVLSHGTMISGLIAAQSDNDEGVAGVAWHATIMPVRMLSINGSGNDIDAAKAVNYAVDNGADIINLSFAGYNSSAALERSIERAYEAGVVVVAAMGNDDVDVDDDQVYPACLKGDANDWVIGVTSSDRDDVGSSFSNYGSSCSDVSAPGEDIFGLMYENIPEGYTEMYAGGWSGTSVASPLVAGTAALLLSAYPGLQPDDVQTLIKLSVDPLLPSGVKTGQLGSGRLHAARALEYTERYADSHPEIRVADVDVAVPVVDEEAIVDTDAGEEAEPVDPGKSSEVLSSSFVAFGAPAGVLPLIAVSRADGAEYATFQAYTSNFSGGVNVALADMNYDGIPEVIAGAGQSGGPHVRVFKAFGAVVSEFFAYGLTTSHGVDVAAGDVDADGEVEVVTAVGVDVSRDVITWSLAGVERSRFTADVFEANVPLTVDLVDIDNDWQLEFVVATGPGYAPLVALYDNDGTYLVSFSPFTDTAGISIAAADVDGDYFDDIAVTSLGASRDVRVFTKIGALRDVITQSGDTLGMRTAGFDVEVDGTDEIILVDDVDAGTVTVRSYLTGEIASWQAPSFGARSGPFIAAW